MSDDPTREREREAAEAKKQNAAAAAQKPPNTHTHSKHSKQANAHARTHTHLEDADAALHVGAVDRDLAVKAAGAQQRLVEHVGPVGSGEHDHARVALKAVHLGQQLVDRLLALVVAAAHARAALAADGVDLVDKDDARRLGLGLFEEVAHAARADADKELDKLGRGAREERRARLAGDRLGEQRLARACLGVGGVFCGWWWCVGV